MDKIKECQIYVKRWYMGDPVLTVRLATDDGDEVCMQYLVVELLRDFLDNPIPEGFIEGTAPFNNWVDAAYRKVLAGMQFGFTEQHESAIKNLAFSFYAQGISRTLGASDVEPRLYRCTRQQTLH